MRLFFAAVSAVAVALLAPSDFSSAKLTAPPTGNWPTTAANLYNQRLLTADGHRPAPTSRSSRASGARACALRHRAAVLGLSRSRSSTTASRMSARAPMTCSRCRSTPARFSGSNFGQSRSEDHVRLLRVEQTRASRSAKTRCSSASSTASLWRSIAATGKVAWSIQGRAVAGELLDHRSPVVLQWLAHHRLCRRRSRDAQPRQGVTTRRTAV